MIHRKEFTKFAKKIVRAQKDLKNQQLMHPRREWMIGIIIAFSIFAASITWSSLQYFEYQDTERLSTDQSDNVAIVYKKALVTQALLSFEQKTTKLNALLGTEIEPDQTPETELDSTDTTAQQTEEMTADGEYSEQTNASSSQTSNASSTEEKTDQETEQTPPRNMSEESQPIPANI